MTQAVILAGGFGTRLRSVVQDLPKPMAPIHGKPFLSYLLEEICRQSLIDEVIFSVHYKHELIQQYFGSSYRALSLKYVVESHPLGTGGAIKNCLPMIGSNGPFFVFNGDSFLQFSHADMYASHKQHHSPITLAVKKMPSCSRYGRVLCNELHRLLSFESSGTEGEGYINAGVYLLNTPLLRDFPSSAFSFEKDFLQKHIDDLSPNVFFSNGYFIDIGIPEDYNRALQDFPNNPSALG